MRRILQFIFFYPVSLLILLLVGTTSRAGGSVRDIFKLTPEKRLEWFLNKEFNRDVANKILPKEVLDSLSVLCEEYQDEKLLWYVRLYMNVDTPDYQPFEGEKIAENCPFSEIRALHLHYLGLRAMESYKIEDGLKLLLEANKTFEEVGYENLFYGGECLNALGLNYYYSGYYATALKYWKRAIRCHFVDIHYKVSVLNNIGLANMAESIKNYPEASRYFALCKNLAQKYDPGYVPVSIGYYGRSLQLRGRVREALPYLIYGYNHLRQVDNIFAATSALFIADAYLKLNYTENAKEYLTRYEDCFKNAGPQELKYVKNLKILALALPYYSAKAELSKRGGDFAKAKFYQTASLSIKDSLDKLSVYQFLDTSESMINAEKYFSVSSKISQERAKEVEVRNLIIVLLLFLGLGITYLNRLRRAKLLKERELEDKKKIYAEQKIATSQETLELYVRMMNEKNELLEKISGELDQLRLKTGNFLKGEGEVHEQMDTLLSSIILSDGDWENFKVLFEQVYPGFLGNLKNKFKDLTASEIRLAALSKLEVPTKEMAYMLSVTKETIHTARYRLRKKLGSLDNDIDLKELIDSL